MSRNRAIELGFLAALGVGSWFIWGLLQLPDAPDAGIWGDIPRAGGWRLFFCVWVPIVLGMGHCFRLWVNDGKLPREWSWWGLYLPAAAWISALVGVALWGRWFLVLSGVMVGGVFLQAAWAVSLLLKGARAEWEDKKLLYGLALASLVMFIALAGWFNNAISTTGDEHIYLLSAHSLLHDGDVDLRNQARQRAYKAFYWGRWHKTYQRMRIWRFPSLLVPAYALGGRLGVLLMLCIAGAATAAMAAKVARDMGLGWESIIWTWVAINASVPGWAGSVHVYPEILAALGLITGIWAATITPRHPWKGQVIAWGCALGLVYMKIRYTPLAFGIILASLWQARSHRRAFKAGIAIMILALAGLASYGPLRHRALELIAPERWINQWLRVDEEAWATLGLWFDQEVGLIFYAPVVILGLSGAIRMCGNNRERLGIIIFPAAAYAVLLGILTISAWDAGFTFPTRFLVPLIPVFMILVARGISQLGGVAAVITIALMAWGAFLGLISAAYPQLLHTRLVGAHALFVLAEKRWGIYLARFFPSFTNILPLTGLGKFFSWTSIAWVALALGGGIYLGLAHRHPFTPFTPRHLILGLVMLGLGGTAVVSAAAILPPQVIPGARMERCGAALYRDLSQHLSFSVLRPNTRVWARPRLVPGTYRFNVLLILPKSINTESLWRYIPTLEAVVEGRKIGKWDILTQEIQELELKHYIFRRLDFMAPVLSHKPKIELIYSGGGTKRYHWVGIWQMEIQYLRRK